MGRNLIYKINHLNLDDNELMLNETIFHNANGYIGVRSNFEEGYPEGYDTIRGSYINGFYDIAEMKQAEKLCGMVEEKQTMLNVADTQGITVKFGGEIFSMFQGKVEESSRWLDMDEGYTGRHIIWESDQGKKIEITSKRMTSFSTLSLFTIEYTIKSINYTGEIEFVSEHKGDVKNYSNPNDPRVAAESFEHLIPAGLDSHDGISYLTSHTSKSGLTVCTAVKNQLSKEAAHSYKEAGHSVNEEMKTQITAGETITLVKYTIFADSVRDSDCRAKAEVEMKQALSLSLEEHYSRQIEYLKEFWDQSALEIDGDDELNLAVSYNLYQLIQSVGKDQYSNIAAKGLSGEGYEGHFFWDTEMYMQPFFVLTNPKIARSLISYRYRILEGARENARILGHNKGVLYPWRTIMGKECSGYFPSGSAQYHINGDIAYSIVLYYLATKDIDFIAEKGAEIILETARLWIDAGNYYDGEFQINEVTGPDEYTCMVNNNYYTNVSAKYNLYWAVKFYNMLKADGKIAPIAEKLSLSEEEIQEFAKAEENMYLPYDETLNINPQDDSFLRKKIWDIENTPKENFPLLLHYHPLYLYRHQVCKQADTVLAHFIFEDAQSLGTIRNSFAYYEKVTTHDSSLSTCIYSIVASKLGLKEKAYSYFGDSAKLDLFNTHKNTKDGIHTANMGGNYMAIVYGFAGLRLKESGIYFAPSLPEQWKGYKFEIRYEDCSIQVEIKGCVAIFTKLKGTEKMIHVYGEPYPLIGSVTIRLQSMNGGSNEI